MPYPFGLITVKNKNTFKKNTIFKIKIILLNRVDASVLLDIAAHQAMAGAKIYRALRAAPQPGIEKPSGHRLRCILGKVRARGL